MEQKKGTPASEAAASVERVTEPKATIKIEGQEFELDAALAQEDKTLKVVLQPHFASVENANITREVKDGKLTVTIVKRAQHKGAR
jgi:diacylglycerol kinase family enzyme